VYPPIPASLFFVDAKEKLRCLFRLAQYLLLGAMIMVIPHDEYYAADQYPDAARRRIEGSITSSK
jgi:hypothetical protein